MASDTGTGLITYEGDSGGGCVDPTMPLARADIFGVNRDSENRPVCTKNADCFNGGTCNVATSRCSNNDPSYSEVQAAKTFRDFAHATMRTSSRRRSSSTPTRTG